MKKGALVQLLNSYAGDDAEVLVSELHKSLMVVQNELCILIKLDGDWKWGEEE